MMEVASLLALMLLFVSREYDGSVLRWHVNSALWSGTYNPIKLDLSMYWEHRAADQRVKTGRAFSPRQVSALHLLRALSDENLKGFAI